MKRKLFIRQKVQQKDRPGEYPPLKAFKVKKYIIKKFPWSTAWATQLDLGNIAQYRDLAEFRNTALAMVDRLIEDPETTSISSGQWKVERVIDSEEQGIELLYIPFTALYWQGYANEEK